MSYNGEQSEARDYMNKVYGVFTYDLQDCDWLAGVIDFLNDHGIVILDELEGYAWRAKYECNSQE